MARAHGDDESRSQMAFPLSLGIPTGGCLPREATYFGFPSKLRLALLMQ